MPAELEKLVDIAGFSPTSAHGGEGWTRGQEMPTTWSSVGNPGSNVKIDLHTGGAFHSTIIASTVNDGLRGALNLEGAQGMDCC